LGTCGSHACVILVSRLQPSSLSLLTGLGTMWHPMSTYLWPTFIS
jgi:hypothetical protein